MFGSSNNPLWGACICIAVAMLCFVSLKHAIAHSPRQHSDEHRSIPIVDPAPTPSSIMANREPQTPAEASAAPPPVESKVRVLPDDIKWSYIYPEQAVPAPAEAETLENKASNQNQANQQRLPESTPSQATKSQPDRNFSPLRPVESQLTVADEIEVANAVLGPRSLDDVLANCDLLSRFHKRCRPRMGLLYRLRFGSPYRDADPYALWSCPTDCDCQPTPTILSIDHADDFSFLIEPALVPAQMTLPPSKQESQPLLEPELTPFSKTPVSSPRNLPAYDLSEALPVTEALSLTEALPITRRLFHPPHRPQPQAASFASSSLNHRSAIIVHPPMVQPNRKNQYTFLIENQADQAVSNVSVQLLAPDTTMIFGALPAGNAIVTDHAALFHIESIPAKGFVEVHVGATANGQQPVDFVSSVSVRSSVEVLVSDSQVTGNRLASHAIRHDPHHENDSQHSFDLEGKQTSLSLPGGSRLIRNPFATSGAVGNLATNDPMAERNSSPTLESLSIADSPSEERFSERPSAEIRISDRRFNDQQFSVEKSPAREDSSSSTTSIPTSNPVTILPSGVLENFGD